MKRPTKAVDMYALGCVAYELLAGKRPFPGPDESDYRDQHLNQSPPELNADPRLRQIVGMCLSKFPDARPSPDRFRSAIRRVVETGTAAAPSILAAVGAVIASAESDRQAALSRLQEAKQTYVQLAADAKAQFERLMGELLAFIEGEAPIVARRSDGVMLGRGMLRWGTEPGAVSSQEFEGTGWNIAFGGHLSVTQDASQYRGRSANLWYARPQGTAEFRWWEMQYMVNPSVPAPMAEVPFACMREGEVLGRHAATRVRRGVRPYRGQAGGE
jgi:eukaryotic-like serine/threonine-protein kinase